MHVRKLFFVHFLRIFYASFSFSCCQNLVDKNFLFFTNFMSQNQHDIRLYSIKHFDSPEEGVPMTRAYLATAAAVLAVALAVFSVASVLPV